MYHRHQFHLMLAEDGSGKGAGLVSAIAQRINARNNDFDAGHNHSSSSNGAKVTTPQTHTSGVNVFHNGTAVTNGHTNGYTNGH